MTFNLIRARFDQTGNPAPLFRDSLAIIAP